MAALFAHTDKAHVIEQGIGLRSEIIRPNGGFSGSSVRIETNISNNRGFLIKDSYFVIRAEVKSRNLEPISASSEAVTPRFSTRPLLTTLVLSLQQPQNLFAGLATLAVP